MKSDLNAKFHVMLIDTKVDDTNDLPQELHLPVHHPVLDHPILPPNMMTLKFDLFLPRVREFLLFIRYLIEKGYFETSRDIYDSDEESTLIEVLSDANNTLENLEFEFTDTISDYDNRKWICADVRRDDVFVIVKCLERILGTAERKITSILTKSNRKTLWKTSERLLDLLVRMGM